VIEGEQMLKKSYSVEASLLLEVCVSLPRIRASA